MRNLMTATLFTSLALSGAAMAAPAIPQDASATSMSVQVVAGPQLRLSASDVKVLQGQYQMSDGSTLNVTGEGRTLYAALDGHAKTELVPTGSNTFSARGEDMILTFERSSFVGNEVTVNMPKK